MLYTRTMRTETKDTVETTEYERMMGRMLRAYGRRVRNKDIATLAGLAAFADDAERVLGETVAYLRTEAGGTYSWAQIGTELGVTRSAAQKRFAKYCTTGEGRRVGGQPSNLR